MIGLARAVARQYIVDRGVGGAQVVGPQASAGPLVQSVGIAVIVQHLAMPDRHLGSCRSLHGEICPSHHVLPEVYEHGLPLSQRDVGEFGGLAHDVDHAVCGAGGPAALIDGHLFRLAFQGGAHPHLWRSLPEKRGMGTLCHGGAGPRRGIVGGRFPIVGPAGVVGLAVVDVGGHHAPTLCGEPCVVGGDNHRGAVGEVDVQRCHKLRPRVTAVCAVGDVATPPSAAHLGGETVVARQQQRGHVILLIGHLLAVIGPPRRKLLVAHAGAVDKRVVHAEGRSLQHGPSHPARQGERLAKHGNAVLRGNIPIGSAGDADAAVAIRLRDDESALQGRIALKVFADQRARSVGR